MSAPLMRSENLARESAGAFEMKKDPATGQYRMMSTAAEGDETKKRSYPDPGAEAASEGAIQPAAKVQKVVGEDGTVTETAAPEPAAESKETAERQQREAKIAAWAETARERGYNRGPPGDSIRVTESTEIVMACFASIKNKATLGASSRGAFVKWEEISDYLGCGGEVVGRQERGAVQVCMARDGTSFRLPMEIIGKDKVIDEWLAKLEGEDERNAIREEKAAKDKKEAEERAKLGGPGGSAGGVGGAVAAQGMVWPPGHPQAAQYGMAPMGYMGMPYGYPMPGYGYGQPPMGYGAYPPQQYPGYGHPQAYAQYPQQYPGQGQAAPAAQPPVSPSGWQALKDESGREYYYNGGTGVTQWEKPPGMP